MNYLVFSKILLCAVTLIMGCGGSERQESDLHAASVDYQLPGYLFVGCRPSAGECRNSCPEHHGIVTRLAPKACQQLRDPDVYLCYCKIKAQKQL